METLMEIATGLTRYSMLWNSALSSVHEEQGGYDRSGQLLERLKRFAVRVIRMNDRLPRSRSAAVLGNQVLRSATSCGAQYCEARRAKSQADYISKVQGILQELDETRYWFDLLIRAGIVRQEMLDPLDRECEALICMFWKSLDTARKRRRV